MKTVNRCEISDLHGNVHQIRWHVLIRSLQVSYKMSREVLVFVGHQRVGCSLLPGAARPTNPVSMGVDVSCHVIVDNRTNVRDV